METLQNINMATNVPIGAGSTVGGTRGGDSNVDNGNDCFEVDTNRVTVVGNAADTIDAQGIAAKYERELNFVIDRVKQICQACNIDPLCPDAINKMNDVRQRRIAENDRIENECDAVISKRRGVFYDFGNFLDEGDYSSYKIKSLFVLPPTALLGFVVGYLLKLLGTHDFIYIMGGLAVFFGLNFVPMFYAGTVNSRREKAMNKMLEESEKFRSDMAVMDETIGDLRQITELRGKINEITNDPTAAYRFAQTQSIQAGDGTGGTSRETARPALSFRIAPDGNGIWHIPNDELESDPKPKTILTIIVVIMILVTVVNVSNLIYKAWVGFRPTEEQRILDRYNKAIRKNPRDAENYNDRGGIYFEMCRENYSELCAYYDNAIIDFTKAIELEPDSAKYRRNRGGAYCHKNDRHFYSSAIERTYLKRSYAEGVAARYDSAIVDFTEAIRLEPNAAIHRFNRGLAYYRKEDYASAKADIIEALRLDPNHQSAQSLLRRIETAEYE